MILPTNKDFWDTFRKTNGALSVAESIAIMGIASQAPIGNFLEMGTYMGKSAMSAVVGLKYGEFVLLEPSFSEPGFEFNLEGLMNAIEGKEIIIKPLAEYSTEYLQNSGEMYSYVFSDAGSHQDGLPLAEVKLLENRMVEGGIIAFHDFRSQFIEVEEAYNYLIGTGKYEPIEINWQEITQYVDENNLEDGNTSWHHQETKNPCFVGALKRKINNAG